MSITIPIKKYQRLVSTTSRIDKLMDKLYCTDVSDHLLSLHQNNVDIKEPIEFQEIIDLI